jgi:hypothetical protein
MPSFTIYRIQRDADTFKLADGGALPAWQVRFFPIRDPQGKAITVEADEAANALGKAKRLFPYLEHSLAVQETEEHGKTAIPASRVH